MARERKAVGLKLLHGNQSKDSGLGQHTASRTGRPEPPADLHGEAYAEWCRVVAYLDRVGHIETVDHAALVVYCSAWAMFDASRRALDELGPLVPGRDGGMVKNPAHQVMVDASKIMLQYGAKFGVTPKDRQSLGIGPNDGDSGDPFAGLGSHAG